MMAWLNLNNKIVYEEPSNGYIMKGTPKEIKEFLKPRDADKDKQAEFLTSKNIDTNKTEEYLKRKGTLTTRIKKALNAKKKKKANRKKK